VFATSLHSIPSILHPLPSPATTRFVPLPLPASELILPRSPSPSLTPTDLGTTPDGDWRCGWRVARDVMRSEEDEFEGWRNRVVVLAAAICRALSTCEVPEVRMVSEGSTTEDQWDRLLSMKRCERAQVWDEQRWHIAQASDVCAVWLDFPIIPRACIDMGREEWMNTASSSIHSPSTRIANVVVTPDDVQTTKKGGRRGQQRKTSTTTSAPSITKSTVYTAAPELLGWCSLELKEEKGESSEWTSREGWQQRQLFAGGKEEGCKWPSHMEVSSAYMDGSECTIFVTDGPCTTSRHFDGISGVSSMMEGWKVFMWWSIDDDYQLSGRAMQSPFSLEAAITCSSFRWTLLGPGTTISISSHVPHAVLTLSASLLCTWVIEEAPHSLVRTFDYILRCRMFDPMWSITEGECCDRLDFSSLLHVLCQATHQRIEKYKEVVDEHPELRSRCLERLRMMRDGWAARACGDILLEYCSGTLRLHPFGHCFLLKEEMQAIAIECRALREVMKGLQDYLPAAPQLRTRKRRRDLAPGD
jgi:hypothetical protein